MAAGDASAAAGASAGASAGTSAGDALPKKAAAATAAVLRRK